MRWRSCVLFSLAWSVPCGAQPLRVLTLSQAIALAERASPQLGMARAALSAAEGESREAAALLNRNPELSVERTQRRTTDADGLGTRYRESAIGITQSFEVAGQPSHRREAAQRLLAAAQTDVRAVEVKVRAEVEGAFAQALLLQRRLVAEDQSAKLAQDAASAVGKRVDAGEDSRLDGNLASVEAERALNQSAAVREQLIEARARLATQLQLPPNEIAEVAGGLVDTIGAQRLEDLVEASNRRPELRAFAEREAAAQSRLKLERAGVFPDVTVGLVSAREGPAEMRERATTLTFSLPLPLFKRNQAGIGRAMKERDQAQIERQVAARNGEAMVRELWQRLSSLEARLGRLARIVLPRLDENLVLATKAYRAGEIGILQLVVVNRQALDARRDYLDALGEFTQARIALEQAAGIHSNVSANQK